MQTIATVVVIGASLCIIFGYLRFITDEKGNINLNNYRLTGGLGLVISGITMVRETYYCVINLKMRYLH